MSRRDHRILMGLGAVLTVQEAANLLPMRDSDARRWLYEQGLVADCAGREVVVWVSVIERLRPVVPLSEGTTKPSAPPPAPPKPAPPRRPTGRLKPL